MELCAADGGRNFGHTKAKLVESVREQDASSSSEEEADNLLWELVPGANWVETLRGPARGAGTPAMALEDLPPLPQRTSGYWYQPLTAFAVVGALSASLVSLTLLFTTSDKLPFPSLRWYLGVLIKLWAALAIGSTLWIVFGRAGEVNRSLRTCYPIPNQVLDVLLQGTQKIVGLRNVKGPSNSRRCGSYCIRCLVWRPKAALQVNCLGAGGPPHHCSTCQRCVVGFDHHCGFFGRCIVSGNMICFFTTIAMMWAGFITTGIAFVVWSAGEEHTLRPGAT